jgi:hypothetical protein
VTDIHPTSTVDALWLDTFQRICERTAHELRGALNGLSINLEVVRSRAARPTTQVTAISTHANAAADQLGGVIRISEAMLALARPPREPVEIAPIVRHMGALLAPVARTDGRRLEFDGPFDHLGTTTAGGNAARLALGAALLAALDGTTHARCVPGGGESAPAVRVESCDGRAMAIDAAIVAAAAETGIRVQAEPSVIVIGFPC